MLEVPIALGESADADFNDSPLVELYEDGSEVPRQTMPLARGFVGIARFDVTRFVRTWDTTEARAFVLGAVSEKNATAFELGTATQRSSGTKARLIIKFTDPDGDDRLIAR